MFVLVGEFPGDYNDFYERPTEVLAVGLSREALVEFWDELTDSDFIGYRIEEAPLTCPECGSPAKIVCKQRLACGWGHGEGER